MLAAFLTFGILPANALTESQAKAIRKAMMGIPALEQAPKAAALVQKSNPKDREEVAVTVTRIILTKTPVLALTVVESIADVAPEVSAAVAAAAAELCPSQSEDIARVAASYAPDQAAEIARGVAKASPKDAINITRRVVGAVPEFSDKITEAVIAAVPAVKSQIEANATLSLASTIARHTGSSAKVPVRKFNVSKFKSRLAGLAPPGKTENVGAKERNKAAQDLVKAIEDEAKNNKLSATDIAGLLTESVNFVNSVLKPQNALDKQAQDSAFEGVKNAVVSIITTGGADAKSKSDVGASVLKTNTEINKDKDLSVDEKKSIADFVNKQLKDTVVTQVANSSSNANDKAKALTESIKSIVAEVKKVSDIAKTTSDPDLIKKQLDDSAKTIGDTVKAYAKP